MKFTKLFTLSTIIWLFLYIHTYQTVDSYFFGLKSADNTITNIQDIQNMYGIYPQVVSYIFEWLPTSAAAVIENLASKIGKDMVYHITISPQLTPKDINKWSYDNIYNSFFNLVKKHDLKVIFRTMHEMNGWRYHRSGDPTEFKKARNRIRDLSRKVWLDQNNILFDFSVNHVDMPAIDNNPSQDAELISCTPDKKSTIGCFSFEDYRPWTWSVDIVWFSMYNRGKWWDDRLRLTPDQIVYDKKWDLLDRLSSYNKPIIIDEVWTTSAKYDWYYDRQTTIDSYLHDYSSKNKWLAQLKNLLDKEDRIKWAIYFNVDYTKWHKYELRWESDWAVLDVDMNKVYYAIYPLIWWSSLDKEELWFSPTTWESKWYDYSSNLNDRWPTTWAIYSNTKKRVLKIPRVISQIFTWTQSWGITYVRDDSTTDDLMYKHDVITNDLYRSHTWLELNRQPSSKAVFD